MPALILPYRGILPRIAPDVFLADTAVIIGDVEIGAGSGIWFGCVLRGDVNVIRIGAQTNIQDGTVIHVSRHGKGTHIGDGVTVGHMALLHDCTIESGAFIGMKSCTMDGSVVESGAMLAAGALLTPGKRIPTGELWAGNPAKLLRPMSDAEKSMIPKSAENYVKLGQEYRA